MAIKKAAEDAAALANTLAAQGVTLAQSGLNLANGLKDIAQTGLDEVTDTWNTIQAGAEDAFNSVKALRTPPSLHPLLTLLSLFLILSIAPLTPTIPTAKAPVL